MRRVSVALCGLITAMFLCADGIGQPLPRQAQPAAKPRVVPKLDAIAETSLLMEGLASPNMRAIGRALKGRPADATAWTLARGQALLLAETGNLLLLRPPRNAGQDEWFERAMAFRESAARLARFAGTQDLERARLALAETATHCNRCHTNFRVPVKVNAFPVDE